jgi:hypothetical protein
MAMKAAQELARKRWDESTQKERDDTGAALTQARQQIPPEKRSEIARNAAVQRWAKKKAAQKKAGKSKTAVTRKDPA